MDTAQVDTAAAGTGEADNSAEEEAHTAEEEAHTADHNAHTTGRQYLDGRRGVDDNAAAAAAAAPPPSAPPPSAPDEAAEEAAEEEAEKAWHHPQVWQVHSRWMLHRPSISLLCVRD